MAPLHLLGKPLPFEESKPYLKKVRASGVRQFINLYRRVENLQCSELLWGDEIEYHVMRLEGEGAGRQVKLSLRAPELLEQLADAEGSDPRRVDGCAWHAEYGRWMVEATPREPYGGYATELLRVERSMRLRRQRLLSLLAPGEIIPTLPSFPMMGVGDFTYPSAEPNGPIARSEGIPDLAINPHPRMHTLTANIRERRGSNVDIRMPLYKDVATPEFKGLPRWAPAPEVRGDAMAYGMGSCCLQVTFQAHDVHESRFLTDQLAALAPIFLSLTAATPIFRGRLMDRDSRWSIISAAVDDRTPAERRAADEPVDESAKQPALAGEGVRRIPKSRYSSISHYIYDCPAARMHHKPNPFALVSDLGYEVDEESEATLLAEGIDESLARHVAFLFSRDPLVVFGDRVDLDDATQTEHFESLQSSNWNSVRWKPPPTMDSPIGWRTEFRPMEVQMTDFENAAFTVVVMLLTRAILAFDLDCLIPLSKVDENMRRAEERDSVTQRKFWFRKYLVAPPLPAERAAMSCANRNFETEEMTISEILNGKGDYFPGLLPLCHAYLESINCDASTFAEVKRYMKLIALRAKGSLLTNAAWQRKFVAEHDDYLSDSVVSPAIAHDLMQAAHEIGTGQRACKEVLGQVIVEPIHPVDAWDVKLDSSRVDHKTRHKLLEQYSHRQSFLSRLRKQTSDDPSALGLPRPMPQSASTPVSHAHTGHLFA